MVECSYLVKITAGFVGMTSIDLQGLMYAGLPHRFNKEYQATLKAREDQRLAALHEREAKLKRAYAAAGMHQFQTCPGYSSTTETTSCAWACNHLPCG